jgi:hypothetical protein
MDKDQTFAELIEQRSEKFPIDLDHHPLNSYSVGWNLGRLQGLIIGRFINDEITVEQVYPTLHHAQLISYDSAQTFQITKAIDEAMEEIQNNYSGFDEPMNEEELTDLVERIGEWSDEYSSDLGDLDVVSIVDRGLVDTRKIFRDPSSIFEEEVWEWLDSHPQQDIKDACKTLALDMRTASSFLALRSVEYCLREWHHEQTGEMIEQTAWGGVLNKLEKEYEDKDKPAVLSNLDYLREKRNGIAHPDDRPSWDEAEDTLFTVRRTITEIYESLPS